ncbi:adenylyltransferase/cytidyltransferase family protein [Paraflavisolibacter sp. H34]|uniref:adenylyltransferase/cytidyltransferase family protein n=1 Tax=Huijunlia imazamoxiresistens TaxID=3127457 RepID=UPI00301B51BC
MSYPKRVMVSGCFDMLHSGHIAFLKEASTYGQVHACIGNDENVYRLKGRYPVTSQEERKYMIDALACVTACHINKGFGLIDFTQELDEIRPDIFVVNEDGASPAKAELCRQRNIEYKILQRIPHENLPPRSTTNLRTECLIPFRIDLAGGWLDQPFVSQHHPGPVLTISLEPTLEFNHRSGMASSTRNKAIELWRHAIPSGDRQKLAKILFTYENPPGTKEVAGSQDALGIVLPGLNRLDYNGHYWPEAITSVDDNDLLDWLEDHLYLVMLGPRVSDYSVLEATRVSAEGARRLAQAADNCWNALLQKDAAAVGRYFTESFEAQVAMFPHMVTPEIRQHIQLYAADTLGWKLSGAGGGGYLIFISEKPVKDAIRVKIRRKDGI